MPVIITRVNPNFRDHFFFEPWVYTQGKYVKYYTEIIELSPFPFWIPRTMENPFLLHYELSKNKINEKKIEAKYLTGRRKKEKIFIRTGTQYYKLIKGK